jgi:chromate transporter
VASEQGSSSRKLSEETIKPQSLGELFRVFQKLALQGFGGVLPIAQRTLVEKQRWISAADFLALLSLSQVLPGPNIVNLAMIFGYRSAGWRGAWVCAAGLLLAPTLLVLALAAVAQGLGDVPAVRGALRGMGLVGAGLILAMAVRSLAVLPRHALARPWQVVLALATVWLVAVLRWPLVQALATLIPLAWWLAHRALKPPGKP